MNSEYQGSTQNPTVAPANWRKIMACDEIIQCVDKCASFVNEHFRGKDVVVACILKGAVYFFVDLTRRFTIPHSCYFIEASSYGNEQTQGNGTEILSKIIPSKFDGKYVVLIDELFDNGSTMEDVQRAIHEHGRVPRDKIFTMTLFKKRKLQNRARSKRPDYYGIELPDVWLVGYGLDDRQEKRNWTHLFACPKIEGIPRGPDDRIFEDEAFYGEVRSQIRAQLCA